jgi:thiosulfate/3-mercaptopyruvate sulfurtransferase
MNDFPPSPLITVDELSERLTGGSPPVLLDIRWTLAGGSDPAGVLAGHGPGVVAAALVRAA